MSIYTFDEFQQATINGSNCDNDERYLKTCTHPTFLSYIKRKFDITKSHRYMITFTLKDDGYDDNEVKDYIIKQLKREPLQIHEAYLCHELTKKGRSHWHAAVTSSRTLKKDRFHYYIKKYGNIDISKTRAQNLEETKNYLSKDSMAIKII